MVRRGCHISEYRFLLLWLEQSSIPNGFELKWTDGHWIISQKLHGNLRIMNRFLEVAFLGPWNIPGLCSDSELQIYFFTLLNKIQKKFYPHSCLSTWLQQWSAEVTATVGCLCNVILTCVLAYGQWTTKWSGWSIKTRPRNSPDDYRITHGSGCMYVSATERSWLPGLQWSRYTTQRSQ